MVSATTIVLTLVLVVFAGLWVGGYLDKYQRIAQDAILEKTGENRASYALKSTLKSEKLSDNKDLGTLQDDLADTGGGLMGKGGIGEKVGSTLSQGL